jgi:hypothetical protein
MAKPNPIATLAEQLVRALREQRDRGPDAYPTTRAALASLAAPTAAADDVGKALKKKPFAAALILAHKTDPHSPLALAEDAEALAASARLLDFALGLICTPQKPAHPPANVVKKIDKALRPAFAAALERRLAADDWPDTVGVAVLKNKPHLYLKRMPPPPPPPAARLAAQLLDALRRLKEGGAYPTTLAQLARLADPAAPPELVRQALAEKAFKPRVVVALANHLDSPVALAEDGRLLAASPLLLETAVAVTRTASNEAIEANDLARQLHKSLREGFLTRVVACLELGKMPPPVRSLRIKGKPYFFLAPDSRAAPAAPPPPAEPAADFARRFDEAFDQLDREKGASNFVSLVALRRALPVGRAAFDAGLDGLRRAGRYTLSGAEGRHGVSDEERDAALREDGALLLYVSRRRGD